MAVFSFQHDEDISDSFSDTYTSEDENDVDIAELCMRSDDISLNHLQAIARQMSRALATLTVPRMSKTVV